MAKHLRNRFKELLAVKERREGRTISQREVAKEIGAALNTVNNIAQNKPIQYMHRITIEKMLTYFNVSHNEFFETVEESDDDEAPSPAVA